MKKRRTTRDPRSEVQQLLDERRARNRAAWARQHPTIAAEERKLRKEQAALPGLWSHKNEGTAETHQHASRHNQGALARLYKSGVIDSEQLASAEEIATIAERIASDVAVKTASLETRVDVTRIGDGGFFEKLGQVRREMAYTEWRSQIRHPAAVLDMLGCFDGRSTLNHEPIGFTIAAQRHHMHHRKAKRLLIEALDLWPRILGDVFKAVDERDLDAAHARLAA